MSERRRRESGKPAWSPGFAPAPSALSGWGERSMASAIPLSAAQTPSTLCGLVNQIFALSGTQDVGCQGCWGHAEMTDDVVVSMSWFFRGMNAFRHPFYDWRPIPPVAWISIRASPRPSRRRSRGRTMDACGKSHATWPWRSTIGREGAVVSRSRMGSCRAASD